LAQEIFLRFLGVSIPFSLALFVLNAVPAAICFKTVGKKFTMYSVLMVVLSGLMTDFMPQIFTGFINLYDPLLSAVFGGILNAVAVVLCLFADATSGGRILSPFPSRRSTTRMPGTISSRETASF